MRRFLSIIAVCLVGLTSTALAQEEAKPPKVLFADETPLQITITGPFSQLLRTRAADEPPIYDATLIVAGEESAPLPITMNARGNFRRQRDKCRFPPLRVRFQEKPSSGSVFHKQKSLKLVTHCRASPVYAQYQTAEYLAYRLFNTLTPASLRVRMANISYVDEKNGKQVAERAAFFIEDIDDMAKRVDHKELEVPNIGRPAVDPQAGARIAVFQYMIGNLDWSMVSGKEGEDCCHNVKLVVEDRDVLENIMPIPYDFDHAGLVDASYANPPTRFKLRSVRDRRYRGFCIHNDEARAVIEGLRPRRDEFLSMVDTVPGMSEKRQKKSRDYIESFFEDIANDASTQETIFDYCRE
ncbi:MAG: hypothetical protein AAF830_11485 [Pseudomonadota bacterium]